MPFLLHGSAPLQVRVTRTDTGAVFTPVGDLDVATAASLGESLRDAAGDEGTMTLDLAQLSFIDVTGVHAVLALVQAIGSRLTVLPGPPHIRRVFELTGVDRCLSLVTVDNVLPFPLAAERNLKYVRRMWSLLTDQGLEAVAQVMPPGVDWLPRQADSMSFTSVGDNVLGEGKTKPKFALYEFAAGTLVRATGYEREADALAASA